MVLGWKRRFVFVLLAAVMTAAPVAAQDPTPDALAVDVDLTPPTLGDFDLASVGDIDVSTLPVIPEVTAHARALYMEGLEQGNNSQVFAKVGDCMTAAWEFLTTCDGEMDFGNYDDLETVYAQFASVPTRGGAQDWQLDSFTAPSLASASGFNTTSALDALWADPAWCETGETPLACEFRVSQPSFAIIMFGTNDVYVLEADAFDYYLRLVVLEVIDLNVVPVLSTFPGRPEFPEKSVLFNQIIAKIAADYDLPLVNLWLALEDLPDRGVNTEETIHLTAPEDGRTCDFTEENLTTGYTMRNLVTLQALDALWADLSAEAEAESDG
jgi:hypothetical protein